MSRVQQSVNAATPASSRYGGGRGVTATPAPSTVGRPSSGANKRPDYEPPQFPLNPKAQRDLSALLQDAKLKQLDRHFNEVVDYIQTGAVDINDRLKENESRLNSRKRSRQNGEGDDDEGVGDLEQALSQLRKKVDNMTERMDESMRKIIDGQQGISTIKQSISQTADEAREHASTQASTQHMRSKARPRRGGGSDAGSEDDDEYPEIQPTAPTTGTQQARSAVDVFKQKLADGKTRYQSKSLYDRYATNDRYVEFRKLVHDARTGDEDAPMPDPEDWFAEGTEPAPGITHRGPLGGDEDSDDDIAVARVQVSTKCCLTMQQYVDPVTSKRCNHSFELDAIMELIDHGTQRRGNDRMVLCPVSGCKEMLTKHDLVSDPVLIRKIKRIQRAKELEKQREDEDEADESAVRDGGTQRNATLIESDDEDGNGFTQIERSTLYKTDNEEELYE